MTTDLVFAEPPEPTSSNGKLAMWTQRLALLVDHPGEWVDATATWGINAIRKDSPAHKAAADLGVTIEVRNTGGGRGAGGSTNCYLRVVA